MPKLKPSTRIKCRFCGVEVGAPGFHGHLAGRHQTADYDAELAHHGLHRVGGRLVPLGQTYKRKVTGELTLFPEVGGQFSLEREDLELAIRGLEKFQDELGERITRLKGQLSPAPLQHDVPRVVDLKGDLPKLLWSGGRHWSNDPENKYFHHTDGTLRLDENNQPILRPSYGKGARRMGRPRGSYRKSTLPNPSARTSKSAPIRRRNNEIPESTSVQHAEGGPGAESIHAGGSRPV